MNRTESFICGRQKFFTRGWIMGYQQKPLLLNSIALYQISRGFAYKDIPIIFLGQGGSPIEKGGASRSELQQMTFLVQRSGNVASINSRVRSNRINAPVDGKAM